MRKFTVEMKVGIFFILIFILIAYMSTRLGDYESRKKYGMHLSAVFPSSAGIDDGTLVNLAGIKIGKVDGKALYKGMARVRFVVLDDSLIPNDSRIAIHSHGFLGQKYLEIIPGVSRTYMKDGDEFSNVEDAGDLTALTGNLNNVAEDIKAITESLRGVFGGEDGEEGLREIFQALNTITTTLADTLEANQDKMDRVMSNIESLSSSLAGILADNRRNLSRAMATFPDIAENLRAISGSLAGIMDRNDEDISRTLSNLVSVTENLGTSLEALASIAQKIDDGEGTLGKLVNEDDVITNINEAVEGINDYLQRMRRLQVEIAYRGEYHITQNQTKSYFNLNIRPRFDKVYLISLIDDPIGRTRHTRTETVTTTNPGAADEDVTRKVEEKDVTTSELLISAQIGKRWHDILFRGGLIESHGGAGIEFYVWEDHLNFAFEVFDFSSGNNPHMKTYLNASFLDHFFLTVGVDDFINRFADPRYFFGAGLYFTDQDAALLVTRMPSGVTDF